MVQVSRADPPSVLLFMAIAHATTPIPQWDRVSADRDLFTRWMRENVLDATPDVFAKHVRGL